MYVIKKKRFGTKFHLTAVPYIHWAVGDTCRHTARFKTIAEAKRFMTHIDGLGIHMRGLVVVDD